MNIVIIKVRNKRSKHSSYLCPSPVQFSAKHWLCNLNFCAHNTKRRKSLCGPSLGEKFFHVHFFFNIAAVTPDH